MALPLGLRKLLGLHVEEEQIRRVYINEPDKTSHYPNNKITNTKYTWWNFLFLNLWEQFSRFMNLYFLFIASLQLIKAVTPVDPASTWVPLAFIFALSAIKEALDDIRRFRRDKQANEAEYNIYHRRIKHKTQSQYIRVGDLLYLECDDDIPCDMVVLTTSDSDGLCYIQTANIDGETDYKPRQAPAETMKMTAEEVSEIRGAVIECAPPNAEIYRFDSRMIIGGKAISLTEKQLLLQGTHLRNTDWVIGVVVYTGNETKVGKNKVKPPVKWTRQDRTINQSTLFIFCFQLSLVFIFGMIGDIWQHDFAVDMWYLDFDGSQPWYKELIIPTRFLLLNSLMIPISLKVSLDIIKYCYAKFIDWDTEMCDTSTQTYANAASTAISEDLGQVEYIFSDKTGTLTENRMVFTKCSIGGVVYGNSVHADNALYDEQLQSAIQKFDPNVVEFFKSLALCHTVVAVQHGHQLSYKAASPDEEALVKASQHLNIIFTSGDCHSLTISVMGNLVHYERLEVLDFTSDRKRMSVLVQDSKTKEIYLYTKGADEVMFPRLGKEQRVSPEATTSHLELFATMGLRTLVIAYRPVSQSEYTAWLHQFQEANTSLDDREQKLSKVYDMLERNLILLGATAIEDKLQDEVPETINALRAAGIKIWMLTGDKFTTAVEIATSCQLIPTDHHEQLLAIRGETIDEINRSLDTALSKSTDLRQAEQDYAIIVEGKSLKFVFEDQEASSKFLELGLQAASVICCRVTPHQKAQVVGLIKNSKKLTLAVGDGGNDVSMIQEANVGVGIQGREGLQAARAADYSIAKFKFLKRLILIHGRYSYIRTAFVAQYCFYKSLLICFCQIAYGFLNGFSGTTFYNTFALTTYNIVFTGLPPLVYVLDKDLPESKVLQNPSVYLLNQSGFHLNRSSMMQWMLKACFQGLIVFGVTVSLYSRPLGGLDTLVGYISLPMIAFSALIVVNTLTVLQASSHLTIINHVIIWGTLISYFLFVYIINFFPSQSLYQVMSYLYADPLFWFGVLLASFAAMVPVYVYRTWRPIDPFGHLRYQDEGGLSMPGSNSGLHLVQHEFTHYRHPSQNSYLMKSYRKVLSTPNRSDEEFRTVNERTSLLEDSRIINNSNNNNQ